MNSKRLSIFLAVAKNLSYTKAADELYLSQPAVSNHIKSLEEELGSQLFDRRGNHIKLTKTGKMTVKYAIKLEHLLKDLQYDIAQMQETLAGSLRIGASTTISQYVIPSAIASFNDQYPDVSLSLISGNTHHINQKLHGDKIDVGIVEGAKKLNDFSYDPFISDEIGVICHKSNMSLPEYMSIEELMKVPLVLRERGSGTQEVFKKALQKKGFSLSDLSINMILGSTESIKTYLKYSAVAGVFSLAAIRGNEESTYLISRIEGNSVIRDYQFIQKQGAHLKLARHFIRFARKQYKLTL